MKKIAIFGAGSAIAFETAKCFANKKAELLLLGRDMEKMEVLKADLVARSQAVVKTMKFDALNFDSHQKVFDNAIEIMGGLDAVLIAHGSLPNQKETEKDINAIIREYNTNALSVITIASLAANYFEQQQSGTIAVISSVAGDRGRQSNYLYGSAKAGVSSFMQGLRNRFGKSEIKVITIKPGMVDTPMTEDLPKGLLFASAATVGKGIYEAMINGKDVVYLPGYWRCIMHIIKHIPESIFKKMSL